MIATEDPLLIFKLLPADGYERGIGMDDSLSLSSGYLGNPRIREGTRALCSTLAMARQSFASPRNLLGHSSRFAKLPS